MDPQRDAIVLHPHRPEPSKGLPQTIEVVDLLVKRHGITNLKVLVPRWLDAGLAPEVREFVQVMQREIDQRGLAEHCRWPFCWTASAARGAPLRPMRLA